MHEVHIDGQLADIRSIFELYAQFADGVDKGEGWTAAEIEPPHTLSRLSKASGLTFEEYEEVKRCLSKVNGLWEGLDVLPGAEEIVKQATPETRWLVRRFPTAARHKTRNKLMECPMVQTLAWIRRNFGIQYPLLVVTEDSW